jgi:hypothetical protein
VRPPTSHIVPVLIGDLVVCRAAFDALLHRHRIYVQPINHSTVLRGTERSRLAPTPLHGDVDIDALVDAKTDCWPSVILCRVAVTAPQALPPRLRRPTPRSPADFIESAQSATRCASSKQKMTRGLF